VAADDVVVIVSNSQFIASRMAGRLDSTNEAGPLKDMKIVVHGLGGKGPQPRTGSIGNGVSIEVLSLFQGHEDSQPRRRNPQTGIAKGIVDSNLVRQHGHYYRRIIWNNSRLGINQF